MIEIHLSGLGKRFQRQWLFRKLDFHFSSEQPTLISGPNGSGKSTLAQIIANFAQHSEGAITFTLNGVKLDADQHARYVSIAAPYLELIEEFTFVELLDFHGKMKGFLEGYDFEKIIELSTLSAHKNKEIRKYSSGMKQRVKLVLALFSNTPILILDEPCTNLDTAGVEWYQSLVENIRKDRLVIVCSNAAAEEADFCSRSLQIQDFQHIPVRA